MGYGAQVRRVPAKSGAFVSDADIYNIGLMGRARRGLTGIQRGIYSIDDFRKACGGFTSSRYMAHVARSFFKTLDPSVQVEMKCLMFQASDATQANYAIQDTTGTPATIYTASAGRKAVADKSAFGNDIALKVSLSENVTFKLTANSGATPTSIYLDQVEGLQVGYYIKIADGTHTEYAAITAIDTSLKKITFSALTYTYSTTNTTVYRQDWSLLVGVKNDFGVYETKEEWKEYPFAASDTLSMAAAVNHPETGSDYIILAVNGSNASPAATKRPAALASWTALTGGADGTAPVDADWNTLVASFADEPMQILLAPESSSTTHNVNMSQYATTGSKFMYYGQAANEANEDTLKTHGAYCRGPVVFGMNPMDKWMETDDPTKTEGKIQIPGVGFAAAHWFNNYSQFGISKVAAGNKTPVPASGIDRLIDSNGIVHDDTNGQGGRLIRLFSVNIARYRRGKGITINSARTYSTDPGYTYQNQIMQFLLVKKSIKAYLQEIEQDRSGVDAQTAHRDAIWAYMKRKYDAGEFFRGQKEDGSPTKFEDVVQIVNDFSVNTLADIANGKETTFVQFVETPPIEEPVLDLASAAVTTVRG